MDDKNLLSRRIDALIRARNEAQAAQWKFDDAHVTSEPDEVSDALREATVELIARLDKVLLSVEFHDVTAGL